MKKNKNLVFRLLQFFKIFSHKDLTDVLQNYLIQVANHQNEKTNTPCYASHSTFAKIFRRSRRTVIVYQKRCEKMGLIYVTHKSENGKKQTNDVRINEAFINNILKQKKMISSENTSQGLCKLERVSSENISHNKPSNKLNYNKNILNYKNLDKNLTPEIFKSLSKYKQKYFMGLNETRFKVDQWLSNGTVKQEDLK